MIGKPTDEDMARQTITPVPAGLRLRAIRSREGVDLAKFATQATAIMDVHGVNRIRETWDGEAWLILCDPPGASRKRVFEVNPRPAP